MKALIIYAHPGSGKFSSCFLDKCKESLKQKNIYFEVLDLYKLEYDPVLRPDELYTAGNRNISENNLQIQEKIKLADSLIFIYPVWWGGMPAVLKGFIDRVFTPGFAFKYNKEKLLKFIPDKLLNDKKILVFVNSGGPKFLYKILLDPIKLINKFFIFGMFSSKSKTYQVYGSQKLDNRKIKEIDTLVKRGLKYL